MKPSKLLILFTLNDDFWRPTWTASYPYTRGMNIDLEHRFFKYLKLIIDSIMTLSMLFEVQEAQYTTLQFLSDVSSVLA